MLAVGAGLAVCAGTVNSIAVKTLGTVVSHVTGSVTKVGVQLEYYFDDDDQEAPDWDQAALLVVFFIFGAFLCGLLVDKNELHFGKSFYGVALMGNSLLLVAAAVIGDSESRQFFEHAQSHTEYASYCAAVACGLQNAMCTSHFGAVVRTTHVTGTATDIGSTAGRVCAILIKRRFRISQLTLHDKAEIDADSTKLLILTMLLTGFLVGTWFGAFLAEWHSTFAFLVPASITGAFGFVYCVFRNQLKKAFKEWANRDDIEKEMEEVEHEVEHALQELDELKRSMSVQHITSAEQEGLRHVTANLKHALQEIKHIESELVHAPDPETTSVRHAKSPVTTTAL
jgi:uncharacterized membrane protein YoaK (UPF0700 family)